MPVFLPKILDILYKLLGRFLGYQQEAAATSPIYGKKTVKMSCQRKNNASRRLKTGQAIDKAWKRQPPKICTADFYITSHQVHGFSKNGSAPPPCFLVLYALSRRAVSPPFPPFLRLPCSLIPFGFGFPATNLPFSGFAPLRPRNTRKKIIRACA